MGRDQCHTWFKAGEIKEGEEGKGGGRQHGIMQKKKCRIVIETGAERDLWRG